MPVYGERLKMCYNGSTSCGKAAVVRNDRSTHFKFAIRWRWVVRFALRLLNLQRKCSLYLHHKRLGMLQKWYRRFGVEINPLNISPWRFVTKYKTERLIGRYFLSVHVPGQDPTEMSCFILNSEIDNVTDSCLAIFILSDIYQQDP